MKLHSLWYDETDIKEMRKYKVQKNVLRRIFIGTLIVVSLVSLGLLAIYIFAKSGCGEETIKKTRLSSQYNLELQRGSCGATTGFSYSLLIKGKDKQEEKILDFDMLKEEPIIQAKLKGNNLEVSYHPATVVYKQVNSFNDIRIKFKRKGGNYEIPSYLKENRKVLDVEYTILFDNDLEIFSDEEILAAQYGYAVNGKGESLGNWNKDWIVIGETNYEIPIAMEPNDPYVYVVKKDEAGWKKIKIASSYLEFQNILKIIDRNSEDREFKEDRKDNPLPSKELKEFWLRVKEANGNREYWNYWVGGKPFVKGYSKS